jgi:predicted RNA-binding protein associated with RNAse of E/G family
MTPITVIKRNLQDEELWRYEATLTRREGTALHLEAPFNGQDVEFMGILVKHGDPFVETYYTDRWYNIFEIYGRDDGALKGWYCIIGKPAVMEAEDILSYVDLALDLWVAVDGTQTVLDEDEFAALGLEPDTRAQALSALEELKTRFARRPASRI